MPGIPTYDVCVIGSGAAGGMVTKELCEAGAKVVLLEAGQQVKPTEYRSHCMPYEMQFRGLRGEKQEPFYPRDIQDTIRYRDSDAISADRIRVLGGRTLHWNAVVLRFAAQDFREHANNGLEDDWPITYDQLEPYYERVEQTIGVCGRDDGIEILPAGKHYLPPIPWRCSEHILSRAVSPMGLKVIPVRKAVLTKPYDKRPACHYCGHCMDGCDVAAIFSTPGSMLPKARATGNLTLRTNALARELLVDDEGRVRAVSIVDRLTKAEEEIKAKVFVVCCAAVESPRLLLNSKSRRFPNGIGNSNDIVGRYLHGHLNGTVEVFLKDLEGQPTFNQDGATDHVYIPRSDAHTATKAYGYQVNYSGFMFPRQARRVLGYGAAFKQRVREMQNSPLSFGGWGKVLARAENRVTVDADRKDVFGIPTPVVHFRFGDFDMETYRNMTAELREMCGRLQGASYLNFGERPGGFASHEVGTVRMGRDPKTSSLNGYCQSHEVKNLFVTDGSSFTTFSEKNPTLTIMALSMRTAEHIAKLRKQGDL